MQIRDKKAVSALVATVLLILITFAAVGIIWGAVMPMITKAMQLSQACTNARLSIDTTQGFTCYSENTKQISVSVSRGSNEFNLVGLGISVSGEGSRKAYSIKKEDSIVLNMPFEEGSGSIINDLSGKGNNGSIMVGGPWNPGNAISTSNLWNLAGRVEKALNFNGTNDSVKMVYSDSLNVSRGFTVMCWFKRNVRDLVYADGIIGNWYWNANPQLRRGWIIRYYINTNSLSLIVETSNGASISEMQVGWNTPSDNTWYHVASVFDSSDRSIRLYVDGVERASTTASAGFDMIAINNSYDLRIGNNAVNNGWFNGTIDEVKIFSRPLSKDEIAKEYESSSKNEQIIYGDVPDKNEARTYIFSGKNIDEISVAPIVRIGNTEKVCDITSTAKVSRCQT